MNRARMELPEEAITAQYPQALRLLSGFDHVPRLAQPAAAPAAPERSPGIARTTRFRSTTPGLAGRSTQPGSKVDLIARIEAVGGDELPSPVAASALRALRRAVALGLAVAEAVSARSDSAALKRDNLEGRLDHGRKAEFAELLAIESLAALSVFANALARQIASHDPAPGEDIGPLREILTEAPLVAIEGALWSLDQALAQQAQDDASLISTLHGFAETLSRAVADRGAQAPRAAVFTQASWHVEADDLTIEGFAPPAAKGGRAPAMAFKRPDEVIGNAVAKHQMTRLSRMIVAYDFERRLNPFVELGGFIFTFLGDGKPGTGKTTLIQMMAGLIHEYCGVAGYPFHYQNFSVDNIDSYQGKSGQNARAFINAVLDPSVIGFGTIDDIDQIAGKRGDRQSSSGQQEVTAVLMDAFAGAGTVVRGNATFGMFSNHAENIDDALRQRAGARFLIDGPVTQRDYIDIFALLLGKRHNIAAGQADSARSAEVARSVQAAFAAHDRPQEEGLAEVFDAVQNRLGPLDDLAELGSYLYAIAERDPRFSGRSVKNITDAIKARAMDFDMPDEWFSEPAAFLHQPYERKLDMIAALRQPITAEMAVQEINRYADSEWRYAETADDSAIDAAVRDMARLDEARRRYAEGRA